MIHLQQIVISSNYVALPVWLPEGTKKLVSEPSDEKKCRSMGSSSHLFDDKHNIFQSSN